MQLHNNLKSIPSVALGGVLAIGNFDGLHLGHQALVARARGIALQSQAACGVMTFEPHPREFFQPQGDPFRLTLLPMKQRLLEKAGVDHLFALAFDQALASLPGDEFIHRILEDSLKASHVVVGADFSFGKGRSGNVGMLQAQGNFKVTVVDPVSCPEGSVYSSTRIRALLGGAKLEDAEKLLGWPWEMEAPVIHGDKRGRTLGYPTANQSVLRYARLPYGIYAVRVLIEGEGDWREGASSFGIRPMFKTEQPVFETFIFDFNREIYGKMMRVRPVRYLRPEMAFDGIPALQEQMKRDCLEAKAVLKSPRL